MFPLGDDNPQINRPIVTYTLIAINVAVWFLVQQAGFGTALNASVCHYGLVPAELFAQNPLEAPPQMRCPSNVGWFGVLSSMFMHGGWMHIIGNMWFLYVFGDNVEDSMGSLRFAIFYVLCGVAAAFAQVVSDVGSNIPMVGASGAIGGVMGAYIMLYPKVKVKMALIIVIIFTTFRIPAIAMLGYWFVVQMLGGISSIGATGGGTAFWAHIGGFVAGAALVWVFKDEELLAYHPHRGWNQSSGRAADIWNDPNNRQ